MMTPSGVCWFWPSRVRCVLPGAPRFRFEVGGWGELIFAIAMAGLAFGAVAVQQRTAGTGGVIRAAIGDIAAARGQYDEQKGSQAFVLRLTGRDNTTFEAITGEYPVRAAWSSSGLLVDDGTGVQTVCKTGGCTWYPEHAVLVSVGPQRTTTRHFEAGVITVEALRAVLAPLEAVGEVYLSGSLRAGIREDGVTVQRHRQDAKLYFADVGVLPMTGRLRDVRLTVQVRHNTGVKIPQIRKDSPLSSVKPATESRLLRWIE